MLKFVSIFLGAIFLPVIIFSSVHASPEFNGAKIPYKNWHKMVMPAEPITLSLEPGTTAYMDGVPISKQWVAPETPGTHHLLIKTNSGEILYEIVVFVLRPNSAITDRGYIGKYRIGVYPKNTPKGFVELHQEERHLLISPHFKIGQFLCKQQPKVWPKYLLVSENTLTKLEVLLADLNRTREQQAETLFVMSGYRTPFYNAAIGSAKFSRHMYGDAADIYLDYRPRDGNMDDMNSDGKITKADANFLYDYSRDLFKKEQLVDGGLGSYKANAVHGPFIHIDSRGHKARWGR